MSGILYPRVPDTIAVSSVESFPSMPAPIILGLLSVSQPAPRPRYQPSPASAGVASISADVPARMNVRNFIVHLFMKQEVFPPAPRAHTQPQHSANGFASGRFQGCVLFRFGLCIENAE